MSTDTLDVFLRRVAELGDGAALSTVLSKAGGEPSWAKKVGRGNLPNAESLLAISRYYGVSVDWLLGVDAEARVEMAEIRQAAPAATDEFVYIPRFDVEASAGNGAYVDNEHPRFTMAFRRYWVENHLHADPKDLSVITVKGDSMEPVLRHRDSILVNHAEAGREDGIYVLRIAGRTVVKRTLWLGNTSVKIISENADLYPPYEVVGSEENDFDFKIIGRVVWFGRQI